MSQLCFAETSEDISPYATFQLSEASTLAQTHHLAPTNTLLHSFMYHERAMTEGCASPPTAAAVRRKQNNKSPYYNVVGYLSLHINWLACFAVSFEIHSLFGCRLNVFLHTLIVFRRDICAEILIIMALFLGPSPDSQQEASTLAENGRQRGIGFGSGPNNVQPNRVVQPHGGEIKAW